MNELTPNSPFLRWCRRLAVVALILIPISVITVRFQLLHFAAGLGMFAMACLFSMLLLAVMAIAALLPRFRAQRGYAMGNALLALPGTALIIVVGSGAGDYPAIHDITTDVEDPPEFVVAAEMRQADHNTLAIKPDVLAIQVEAYPDITTIVSDLPPPAAFVAAGKTAEALGWEIYSRDTDAGLIEASVTTAWFGFVDDVVIRVRAQPDGALVDLRSVSRVGRSDLGANAARIRAFGDAYREIGAQ